MENHQVSRPAGLAGAHCEPRARCRGPEGAGAVPGGADADRGELLCACREGRATWQAHLHLPGFLPEGPAQSHEAPVLHACCAPAGGAAYPRGPH